MMEWVESTLARISSKSTFTASIAAVKSSMSLSQARTIRFTWSVSCLAPFSRSFNSPTSYFTASTSRARLSTPGTSSPPGLRDPKKDTFLSTSCVKVWICEATCDSKSEILLVSFFSKWLSDALDPDRPPDASPPLPSGKSAKTLVSSLRNCSRSAASALAEAALTLSSIFWASAEAASEAKFFRSATTCDTSAGVDSLSAANVEFVSWKA
mmetsp:Transcript_56284/g.131988  ORF Transcript_56284/g.131988 Transcript_56284/m.131988 type:complete len:211 (-) Transcript_56284:228-860(-)